ncbi:MAG: EscU/YscU/HrcU family type III secretion system export apparatus switch protein [Myxococcota bacterium]
MAEDDADKKHDPSERALREAGERGELPRSPELGGVMATIAIAAALSIGGAEVARPIVATSKAFLTDGGVELDIAGAVALLRAVAWAVARAIAVPLGVAALVGLVVGLAQTRFQIATRAFEAKMDHLDPFATFQRLYLSKQPLVELAKGLLHVFALGAITGYAIWERVDELPRIAATPAGAQITKLSELASGLVTRAVPVMLLLAAVDYSWAYFTWWQGLKRTDQQVREENKESDGDPHMKAMRRRRMRELASRNLMKQLKEADVLVTNPTHFAVGLRYRHGQDAAPVVVVKAVDHLALKLRQEAFRMGIPRVEDRVLARALYAQVPRGRAVPAELYGPVAKVLAVVYRRRKGARRAATPPRR